MEKWGEASGPDASPVECRGDFVRGPPGICAAPVSPPVAAQALERASVLRYASLFGNIRAEPHMPPPVSTGPMSPAWSPDGRWIAFAMAGDIWRVPAEGGTAEQLTRGPWYHFEPDWSPDGSRIVMTEKYVAEQWPLFATDQTRRV